MTKSQKRAEAHRERQVAQGSRVEVDQDGGYYTIRTPRGERKRGEGWARWAERGGGGDFDYSMNG